MALACAVSAGLLGPASRAAADPSAVELRVLSYNTHGLPAWIARDDPERRTRAIARLVLEFSDGARPLSDHPALFTRLRVRPLF